MNIGITKDYAVQNYVKQVIFVDDNEDEYELLQRMFQEFMPRVDIIWFSKGDKFIEFLKSQQSLDSTVVLMDVNMPIKGAKEILSEMQQSLLMGKVPVIVMSVFQKVTDKDFYAQFPNVSFLTKPCGLAEYDRFIASLGKYLK